MFPRQAARQKLGQGWRLAPRAAMGAEPKWPQGRPEAIRGHPNAPLNPAGRPDALRPERP
jgi:hypothetical protein